MTLVSNELTVFIPLRLVNPTNERAHWSVRSKRAKAQRDAVAMAVYNGLREPGLGGKRIIWWVSAKPATPKRVTLTGHVARKFDTDGLQAAMKSVRDGLQDCGLIHHDGPDSGHTFTYAQRVAKPLGVSITISMGG